MEFFNSAIEVLQTLVVALGAGLGVWGGVNLLEGPSVPASACGAASTCWKGMVRITPARSRRA